MNIQAPSLRPLKAGEILDRAFRLYRTHFWLLLGAACLTLIPLLIFELLTEYQWKAAYFFQLLNLFIRVNVVNGAMVWLASRLYLGQPALVFKAYWKTLGHFVALFVANFRLGVMYLATYVLWLLGMILIFMLAASWREEGRIIILTGVAMFSAVYITYCYVRWGLYLPIIMIEGLGGKAAEIRSWLLIKNGFWRASVVLVSASLLSYLVGLLPAYAINAIAERTDFNLISSDNLSFFNILMRSFGTIISLPLTTCILTVFYYDLRIRREGYDLQLALGMLDEDGEISEQNLPDSA